MSHIIYRTSSNLEHDMTEELPETVEAEDGFVVGETANGTFTVTTDNSF